MIEIKDNDLVVYCSECNHDFSIEYNLNNDMLCYIHKKNNCELSNARIIIKINHFKENGKSKLE